MRIDNLENHMVFDEPDDFDGCVMCADCEELVPEDEAVEINYELYCDACAMNYDDEEEEDDES